MLGGDAANLERGIEGNSIARADFHFGNWSSDVFRIGASNGTIFAKSTSNPTMSSCQTALTSHNDDAEFVAVSPDQTGRQIGIGGWICLRTGTEGKVGALQVVSLSTRPEQAVLNYVLWNR
jgi:hypothetical protein